MAKLTFHGHATFSIECDDGSYDCTRGEELSGLDDRVRCEFIFDNRNGFDVVMRDLNFHTVQVPVD